MENTSFYAIIVAGGSGKRMNTAVPKQFLMLNGLPVLMHTIQKFHQSIYQPKIILVLAAQDIQMWNNLVEKYRFSIVCKVVEGGTERFFSVKKGLSLVENKNAIVAIHDAVRPLVSSKTISNCFKIAQVKGNAVAAVLSKDSVRIRKDDTNKAINRSDVYLVQTPQTFSYEILAKSYTQEYNSDFTDDASVVEKAGHPIFLEEGDQFNFKITYPEDLLMAETILNYQDEN